MALSQGKYKPSIAAIDEVDDRSSINMKHEELQKQLQQIEGSETAPLTTNQQKLNIDDNLASNAGKDVESQKGINSAATSETQHSEGNSLITGLRGRRSLDALMSLSRKRRILYITTACLCALLLVIIILMIAFWPEVPFYMKAKLCLEKECVQSSQQLLLWANTSKDACHETYEWACGNFAQDYADNDYYVIKRGEWNYKTYNEYHELNELNRFISMLSSSGNSFSVASMISSLYRSCREIDTLDKSQSDLLLKQAINSVEGWQAFRDSFHMQKWDYKKALVRLQVLYGIFPYYKISIENRYNSPHEYIISIDEGDLGLPNKYFYTIDQNDEIIRGYKLLLRDFAINLGIVSRDANLFADEIYHYEKRIVSHIENIPAAASRNEIKLLSELKTLAPSLPIFESIQALFPRTKFTDDTEVLVRNVEVLNELSTVLSTSDKKPINNFIIWSLARHMLPHLSKEYRNLMDTFDHSLYGRTASIPRWMICTKIVRDWIPFAVAIAQQHSENSSKHLYSYDSQRAPLQPQLFPNKTQGNDEFLQLLYHSVVNQLKEAINEANWMDEDLKIFINNKLTAMRLEIGIPKEVLHNEDYIEQYYKALILTNLYFVDHLGSIWNFRKSRMEEKLKPMEVIDIIISEMYSSEKRETLAYSKILNMLIISRDIAASKYYDYRYPASVNFARLGADILELLVDNLATFVEQYKADSSTHIAHFEFGDVEVACLTQQQQDVQNLENLSAQTIKSIHNTLSAARIAAKALSSFTVAVDATSPIMGASIDPQLNYENLRLAEHFRLPGLRSYNENELFTLAYMQKHCSATIADKDYARIKPHVERQVAERYLFSACWNHIQFLPRSSSCTPSGQQCSNIL